MSINLDKEKLQKIIMVGDRILVKPKSPDELLPSGLILPPSVQEKEKLGLGYVISIGPGFAIPSIQEVEEPWQDEKEKVKYIPLQMKIGDLCVYLQGQGFEIEFQKDKYLIISSHHILMLVRDDELFD